MHLRGPLFPALLAFTGGAAAHDFAYTYSTATITECLPKTPGHKHFAGGATAVPHVVKPHGPGDAITVHVQAPHCRSCGCDSCQYVRTYTTEYDVICETGITKQKYVVEETHKGIASKPHVADPTIPFGFKKELQTCTVCGPKPVTATIICPITEAAYATEVPEPHKGQKGQKVAEHDHDHAGGDPDVPVAGHDKEAVDLGFEGHKNDGGHWDSGSAVDSHANNNAHSGDNAHSEDGSHAGYGSNAGDNSHAEDSSHAGYGSNAGDNSHAGDGSHAGPSSNAGDGSHAGGNAQANAQANAQVNGNSGVADSQASNAHAEVNAHANAGNTGAEASKTSGDKAGPGGAEAKANAEANAAANAGTSSAEGDQHKENASDNGGAKPGLDLPDSGSSPGSGAHPGSASDSSSSPAGHSPVTVNSTSRASPVSIGGLVISSIVFVFSSVLRV